MKGTIISLSWNHSYLQAKQIPTLKPATNSNNLDQSEATRSLQLCSPLQQYSEQLDEAQTSVHYCHGFSNIKLEPNFTALNYINRKSKQKE